MRTIPAAVEPRVLVIGADEPAREQVAKACQSLGASVSFLPGFPPSGRPQEADTVLLFGDPSAAAEGKPDAIRERLAASFPARLPTLVWVTVAPDRLAAERALSCGVDDVLRLSDEALFGARLKLHTDLARMRRTLQESEARGGRAAQAIQRNRLYRALSVGKAEWEKTFDTIADCISIIGPDYTIRRANRALAQLADKAPKDLIGMPCHLALHGNPLPCPRCPVGQVFSSGEAVRLEAETFPSNRTFDYHAYPLKEEDGRVTGAIIYGRDITQEERFRRSLLQSEKLMTVGQIAAGIAHEINNPLTAVSSYAQLLSMRLTDPKGAESARRIEDGIARIHRLVQNLTSFVRPAEDTFYPLDLNEIVADVLSFSRYDVTRGETRLVQALGEALPRVLGAKAQLEQVLVNLLTNARDALGGRGSITVRTFAEGDKAAVQVEDDGVGFSPDDAARIFEPFYTTKPQGKGTGLGLFVAAGIARKHHGEILVASEPGRGSRFTLTLPIFRT